MGTDHGDEDGGDDAGVPSMPFTSTQCMTEKDLVPKRSNKDANCTILEQKITGNKVLGKQVHRKKFGQ